MKRDENGDLYDRDGKWSTSTVVMSTFLGACIGFVICHKIYIGFDKIFDIPVKDSYQKVLDNQ